MYLFNILEIQSEAARRENLVALHLVKACDFWTDTAQAEFELRYIKTKEKQEIDFCVVRDRKPWMLVECKSQRTQISPALEKFSAMLKPTWSFQLVDSTSVYKKFPHTNIILTSYERFCAGLV